MYTAEFSGFIILVLSVSRIIFFKLPEHVWIFFIIKRKTKQNQADIVNMYVFKQVLKKKIALARVEGPLNSSLVPWLLRTASDFLLRQVPFQEGSLSPRVELSAA